MKKCGSILFSLKFSPGCQYIGAGARAKLSGNNYSQILENSNLNSAFPLLRKSGKATKNGVNKKLVRRIRSTLFLEKIKNNN
jgi:hypothetical protein